MKKIRGNFVKDSLLDYESLAQTLKENTSNAVKDILAETVRETYAKLMTEDEDEYDEEEVEDTELEDETKDAEEKKGAKKETDEAADMEGELEGEDVPEEQGADVETLEADVPEETPVEDGSEGDEWAEFDKYKVSNDEYDLSNAEDEDIVKVYKLMKDDDQVLVNVDNSSNTIELKDNSTGAEYLLDLGSDEASAYEEATDDMGAEGDLNYDEGMNESRIFEIALNEYDSHVGYTDNYQSKDVMTNPGMSEPGKNVNDWDAGAPKGTEKPWVGKKGSSKPFEKKNVSEEEEVMQDFNDEEANLEEGGHVYGKVQAHSTAKTAKRNNPSGDAYVDMTGSASKGGEYKGRGLKAEAKMMAKVDKILKENKALKKALTQFKGTLQEAAVTNLNLGQIIKLISENATSKAEKQEIIARFGKEARTVEESKRLYESISNELKKTSTMNINEDKQFTTNGSQMINETQIYQSDDLLESLDLMHRICK